MTNAVPARAVLFCVLAIAACRTPKGTLATDLPPPVPPGDPNAEVEPVEDGSPAPEPVADAVTAAPEQFEVVADSGAARLLLATWSPGASAAMHSHPEHLIVALTAGTWAVDDPRGNRSEQSFAAGDVQQNAAVAGHAWASPAEQPAQLLILERKDGASDKPAEGASADAASASPEIFEVIADGEWVRVLRGRWKPGGEDAMHSHPSHLIYLVTDGRWEVEVEGGEKSTLEGTAGTGMPGAAVAGHSLRNVGDGDAEMLIFELK